MLKMPSPSLLRNSGSLPLFCQLLGNARRIRHGISSIVGLRVDPLKQTTTEHRSLFADLPYYISAILEEQKRGHTKAELVQKLRRLGAATKLGPTILGHNASQLPHTPAVFCLHRQSGCFGGCVHNVAVPHCCKFRRVSNIPRPIGAATRPRS